MRQSGELGAAIMNGLREFSRPDKARVTQLMRHR
jgi:hypothetical protein